VSPGISPGVANSLSVPRTSGHRATHRAAPPVPSPIRPERLTSSTTKTFKSRPRGGFFVTALLGERTVAMRPISSAAFGASRLRVCREPRGARPLGPRRGSSRRAVASLSLRKGVGAALSLSVPKGLAPRGAGRRGCMWPSTQPASRSAALVGADSSANPQRLMSQAMLCVTSWRRFNRSPDHHKASFATSTA